jgi:hypothetical protein
MSGLPDRFFDLLFTSIAHILAETPPMKNPERGPEMAFDPVFNRVDFASACHA